MDTNQDESAATQVSKPAASPLSKLASRWILVFLFLIGTGPMEAAAPSFGKYGYPFYSKKVAIVWAAPTNQLPTTLRVFKPIASKFSANAASNLIALSGFTDEDRTTKTYQGEKFSKDVVAFRSKDERSNLTISPGG